jgi:hypothetical protein
MQLDATLSSPVPYGIRRSQLELSGDPQIS